MRNIAKSHKVHGYYYTITLIIFLAVERQKLTLSITEWTSEIGDLLQEAHDNRPQSQFCIASGRGHGFI